MNYTYIYLIIWLLYWSVLHFISHKFKKQNLKLSENIVLFFFTLLFSVLLGRISI